MIRIGSTTPFRWSAMKNGLTNEYVNTATVTGSLQELNGTVLASFNLVYETGTNGNYSGVIPASETESLTECTEYLVVFTATVGQYKEVRSERHSAEVGGYE